MRSAHVEQIRRELAVNRIEKGQFEMRWRVHSFGSSMSAMMLTSST